VYGFERGLFCRISQEPASSRESWRESKEASWAENGTRGLDLRGAGCRTMMAMFKTPDLQANCDESHSADAHRRSFGAGLCRGADAAAATGRGAGQGRHHRGEPARAAGAAWHLSLDAA